jgi:hypothetical protein
LAIVDEEVLEEAVEHHEAHLAAEVLPAAEEEVDEAEVLAQRYTPDDHLASSYTC